MELHLLLNLNLQPQVEKSNCTFHFGLRAVECVTCTRVFFIVLQETEQLNAKSQHVRKLKKVTFCLYQDFQPFLGSLKSPWCFVCVQRVKLVLTEDHHYKHYNSSIWFLALARDLFCSRAAQSWKKKKKEKKNLGSTMATMAGSLNRTVPHYLLSKDPARNMICPRRSRKEHSDSCGSEQNRCFLSNTFIHPFFY